MELNKLRQLWATSEPAGAGDIAGIKSRLLDYRG